MKLIFKITGSKSIGSFHKVLAVWGFMCILLLFGCNSENAPDCLQNSGDLTRITVDLPTFSSITVFENLNLVLRQGDTQSVEIESGEFLINDITASVDGDRLVVQNDNGCNIFREYGRSTIYVTSPNIEEVRSSTGLLISSDGPLNYPDLTLVSESFNVPEAETTDGSFDMELANEQLTIVVNGIAFFRLRGTTNRLEVVVAAGDSRIEASDLEALAVDVNHRGSNDILVNPQEEITGIIRGYGDVVSFNRPVLIEVAEIFEGRLLFR